MNLLPSTAGAWIETVLEGTTGATDRDLFVLPPFPMLHVAQLGLSGSAIRWGGQDVHEDDFGAHTGDVSAPMLSDLGCTLAEIGHSERRRDHGESDSRIAGKVRAALRWNLTPLLCVGERTPGPAGPAIRYVQRQLRAALGPLSPEQLGGVVVAYEPVWAIGEGARAAALPHVAALHHSIRRWLDARDGQPARVLYGGSVDVANAPELLAIPVVDGLFVGRAALDPATFASIATLPISRREVPS